MRRRATAISTLLLLIGLAVWWAEPGYDLCWGDDFDNTWIGVREHVLVFQVREPAGRYPRGWWPSSVSDLWPVYIRWTPSSQHSSFAGAFIFRLPLFPWIQLSAILPAMAMSARVYGFFTRLLDDPRRGFEPIFPPATTTSTAPTEPQPADPADRAS